MTNGYLTGRGAAMFLLKIATLVAAILLPATSVLAEGSFGPCIKDITVTHMSVDEETGKHTYNFKGTCQGPGGRDDERPAEITFHFDAKTGVLLEQVRPATGNSLLNMKYQCEVKHEGLRFVLCSLTSKTYTGPYHPKFEKEGNEPLFPMTYSWFAITNYLREKVTDRPPPVVNHPAAGKVYELGEMLPVGIQKGGSLWHRLAAAYNLSILPNLVVPEKSEKRFAMEIDGFVPGEGGGKWRRYVQARVTDGVITHGTPIYLDTGMYRVRARHVEYQGDDPVSPWSPYQVFWSGDKADYTGPVPSLDKPADDQWINQEVLGPNNFAIPLLASKPASESNTWTAVEFSVHYSDQGVWKDLYGGTPEPQGAQGSIGVEKVLYVKKGQYRARVRYQGAHPWSAWHYVAAGTGSPESPKPDLRLTEETEWKIIRESNNWIISPPMIYRGYRNALDQGPVVTVMVACIARGGTPCPEPNPEFHQPRRDWWQPTVPGLDPALSQQYYAHIPFRFRPEKMSGQWLLAIAVDPYNFIAEQDEGNNSRVMLFEPASGQFKNGGQALVEALLNRDELPEGLDADLLQRIQGNGGKTKVAGGAAHPPDPGKTASGAGMQKLPGPGNQGAPSPAAPQALAHAAPRKLGAKLAIAAPVPAEELRKTAGLPFDLVFPLLNSGDEASGRTSYAVACKVLGGGGTCPFAEKTGTQEPIGAGKHAQIELRRLAFPAGDYELALKLADGTTRAFKLKVAVAKVSPDKIKSAPKLDLNKGSSGEGPQSRPRLRVP